MERVAPTSAVPQHHHKTVVGWSILAFLHDGTEQLVNRPSDSDEQGCYYSGKKKQHTLKNVVLIGEESHICFLSTSYGRTWHDKVMTDQEHKMLPAHSILYQDMVFQGLAVVDVPIMQPKKKPRGANSTTDENCKHPNVDWTCHWQRKTLSNCQRHTLLVPCTSMIS